MFCARCGSETSASPCGACGASPYLDGRYKLESVAGRRAGVTTWHAVDIVSRQRVAVRELPVNGALGDDVKARLEALYTKLSAVKHRAVPKIAAAFVGGDAMDPVWWVVRAWVEGSPLSKRLAVGAMPEAAVVALLEQLLPAVGALHGMGLAHGAIDLDNVVQREDGAIALLDPTLFEDVLLEAGVGADRVSEEFAAPEERRGAAAPASDLYRVGLVAACLLAGARPADLRGRDGRYDLSHKVEASPAVVALLTELTQADPGRRPVSVGVAVEALGAAKSNPASTVGITSSWEEYTPLVTPKPAPERPAETPPPPRPLTSSLPGVTVATTSEPSQRLRHGSLPGISSGPLPLAQPGPPPPPPSTSGGLIAGVGCGLGLLLVAGVGAAVAIALGLGWLDEEVPAVEVAVADPAPVPLPVPSTVPAPSVPSPEPVLVEEPEGLDAPVNPENGLIRIRCERRALISINGRAVDRTPLDLELAPGTYNITAIIPGIDDWEGERRVVLRASGVEEVLFEL